MRRILGVDPGLRRTGYGAIVCGPGGARVIEAGTIEPDARLSLERRLGLLYAELCAVIGALRPDVVVVEELWSAYKHPATAVLMGHARGALCLAADANGVALRHLAHALVKRSLTGSGAARKEQVRRTVMQRLALTTVPSPLDVSDALALALALADVEGSEARLVALGVPTRREVRGAPLAARDSLRNRIGR